jgi:hypothetical protein
MTTANPMAELFGNTVLITAPEGWTRVVFRPDRTIGGVNAKGEAPAGRWVVENGMVWEIPTARASFAAVGKHACRSAATARADDYRGDCRGGLRRSYDPAVIRQRSVL